MTNSKVKISYPALKFAEKARKPGGISRQAAIADALDGVESLRESSIAQISASVEEIEEILAGDHPFGQAELTKVTRSAGRIVMLAETFGYSLLSSIAKSLCDLAEGFAGKDVLAPGPLVVHASAMRLALPPQDVRGQDAERILGELSRILVYFGCTPREETRLRALSKLVVLDTANGQNSGGTTPVIANEIEPGTP